VRIVKAKKKGNRNDWSAFHSIRVGETVEVQGALISITKQSMEQTEANYIRNFCNKAFGNGNYSVSVYGEKIVLTRHK